MRISDWSSDVCSSDLIGFRQPDMTWIVAPEHGEARVGVVRCGDPAAEGQGVGEVLVPIAQLAGSAEVGAAEAPDEAFEPGPGVRDRAGRSEEHTSELQSLMRISYAVFCLKKKTKTHNTDST